MNCPHCKKILNDVRIFQELRRIAPVQRDGSLGEPEETIYDESIVKVECIHCNGDLSETFEEVERTLVEHSFDRLVAALAEIDDTAGKLPEVLTHSERSLIRYAQNVAAEHRREENKKCGRMPRLTRDMMKG